MKSKSSTRLDRQNGNLIVYYKRRNEKLEKPMMSVKVMVKRKKRTKSERAAKKERKIKREKEKKERELIEKSLEKTRARNRGRFRRMREEIRAAAASKKEKPVREKPSTSIVVSLKNGKKKQVVTGGKLRKVIKITYTPSSKRATTSKQNECTRAYRRYKEKRNHRRNFDEMDDATKEVLKNMKTLNESIRRKYKIGHFSTKSRNEHEIAAPLTKSKSESSLSSYLSTSSSSRRSSVFDFWKKRDDNSEPVKEYNWRKGRNSELIAMTPFPNARSPASRHRARMGLLRKSGSTGESSKSSKSSKSSSSLKSSKSSKSSRPSKSSKKDSRNSKSGETRRRTSSEIMTAQAYDYRGYPTTTRCVKVTTTTTRVATPTKYPNARSPASRARAREKLMNLVQTKSKKKSDESQTESEPNSPAESETLDNLYYSPNNCCRLCGGCLDCIKVCMKHNRPIQKNFK